MQSPKTENIAALAEIVGEAPSTSIQRRSLQWNISETSLRRILNKDLDDIHSSIGSGVEANWPSNAFLLR